MRTVLWRAIIGGQVAGWSTGDKYQDADSFAAFIRSQPAHAQDTITVHQFIGAKKVVTRHEPQAKAA